MHSFTVLITCGTAISWAPQFACLPGAAWGAGVRAENKAETVPATNDSHCDSKSHFLSLRLNILCKLGF